MLHAYNINFNFDSSFGKVVVDDNAFIVCMCNTKLIFIIAYNGPSTIWTLYMINLFTKSKDIVKRTTFP